MEIARFGGRFSRLGCRKTGMLALGFPNVADHNADTSDNGQPLYLGGLSQYNRRSKRGALLAGSPFAWDGAEPFREERCAAKARRRTSLWLRLPLAGAAAQNNASVVVLLLEYQMDSVLLFPAFLGLKSAPASTAPSHSGGFRIARALRSATEAVLMDSGGFP
jgi:hypothetical protein